MALTGILIAILNIYRGSELLFNLLQLLLNCIEETYFSGRKISEKEIIDLFDNKETLKKLMPKLVRSFALDAIELNTRKKYKPKIEDAGDFLKKSATANTSIHPGVGDGNNLRLQSEEVVGGALVWNFQVIHLSVFRNDDLS